MDALIRWALVLVALGAVGFGEYRVHEAEQAHAEALKNKEAGWKRAAKQDAAWESLETAEQLQACQANYLALTREFSDYQSTNDCKAKK